MTSILKILFFLSLTISVYAIDKESQEIEVRILLQTIILESGSAQTDAIDKLFDNGSPEIKIIVNDWKVGRILGSNSHPGKALHFVEGVYYDVLTGDIVQLDESEVSDLKKLRPSRKLRKKLQQIIDTVDVSSKDPSVRIDAALKLGLSNKAEYVPALRAGLSKENDLKVKKAFEEALAISLLVNGSDEELLQSISRLGELQSIYARDRIADLLTKSDENRLKGNTELIEAAHEAVKLIDYHQEFVEIWGNLFRGFSLGSVLLIVSFGLAITFGLMGIINMAHGEFIALGGYTCYVVQNIFANYFPTDSYWFGWYFVVSLPVSFLVAGFLGYILEKGFIRFLYKRPLESLLATWGLSMVLQQVYRLIFGAANVQVNTPQWLLGSYDYSGISMSYTRIFVVGLALVICFLTWLLLSKTKLGLYIRAVMQNREMASSLGIPVSKVNSLTFAFGCGLASLAGAAISQIGNVGPSMGQAYLVDSFMVVVIGSLGNLLGAGLSSVGIGIVDQYLQPALGPVMGKITVFFVIILFLQWKPGGLFPSKSRSLDD